MNKKIAEQDGFEDGSEGAPSRPPEGFQEAYNRGYSRGVKHASYLQNQKNKKPVNWT